jgi:hypothetical protein
MEEATEVMASCRRDGGYDVTIGGAEPHTYSVAGAVNDQGDVGEWTKLCMQHQVIGVSISVGAVT